MTHDYVKYLMMIWYRRSKKHQTNRETHGFETPSTSSYTIWPGSGCVPVCSVNTAISTMYDIGFTKVCECFLTAVTNLMKQVQFCLGKLIKLNCIQDYHIWSKLFKTIIHQVWPVKTIIHQVTFVDQADLHSWFECWGLQSWDWSARWLGSETWAICVRASSDQMQDTD